MSDTQRNKDKSSSVQENIDLKAEIESALALVDELSTKSSDSGLSEETCWELFGGPCPEGLRKKNKSVENYTPFKQEANDFLQLNKASVTEGKGILQKDKQSKEDKDDETDQQSIVQTLENELHKTSSNNSRRSKITKTSKENSKEEQLSSSAKNELPKSDNKTPQMSNTSKEIKLSEEIKGSKEKRLSSIAEKELPKNDNETPQMSNTSREINLSKEITGSKGGQISGIAEKMSKIGQLENNSIKNKEPEGNGTTIEKEAAAENKKKDNSKQKSLDKVGVEEIIRVENLEEKTQRHSKSLTTTQTALPLEINSSNKTETSKYQARQEPLTKISVGSGRKNQSVTSKTTYISTSVSTAGSTNKSDTSESSDVEACNCVNCIERNIRKSRKKKTIKCKCFEKEPEYCQCCNQELKFPNNKLQIKIYSGETVSGEADVGKRAVQMTSFDDNNPKTHSRKMQTSMINILNNSASKHRCCCMPFNIDPLFLNSGCLRPVYSSKSSSSRKNKAINNKAINTDGKCSGDFKRQSVKLHKSSKSNDSDEDSEFSSKSSRTCDSANKQEHCCFADSLKEALLKRSVKKNVEKFENRNNYSLHVYNESDHSDFHRVIGSSRDNKYKDRNPNPISSKNEIRMCRCCNEPKQIVRRRPNVPIPPPCACCNHNNYYK